MERVSTNLTLFYKIFIPVFWIVFMGAFTLAIWLTPASYIGAMTALNFRLAMVFIFLSGVALLYFTLLRLKRVEINQEFVYVTNYFKNVRYPYHNIEGIAVSRFLILTFVRIRLKTPGSFGKNIFFIASTERLKAVIREFPGLSDLMV
jgi:hypothetical protein